MRIRNLFILLLYTLVMACAVEEGPGGGPEDKKPPEIVSTYPAPDSTNISTQEIRIAFSERVDKKSVEKAVFVSPFQREPLTFEWNDNALTIILGDSVMENTTYVISIGTDAKDARNNNLRSPYTLAFSTGATINNASISGKAYGQDDPSGIYVWAFKLSDGDSLCPTFRFPKYITQTGEKGEFTLSNLSAGMYRLFLVKDISGDRDYWPEADLIGIPQEDVSLPDDSASFYGMKYLLSKADTTGPRLISAVPLHNKAVAMKFTEQPDSTGRHRKDNYTIADSSGTVLPLTELYDDLDNPGTMIAYTGLQDSTRMYFVKAINMTDIHGNALIGLNDTISFFGSAIPDTVRPLITAMSFRDSASSVDWRVPFSFTFSEAMNEKSVEDNIQLIDKDTALVPLAYNWRTPRNLSVHAAGGFKEEWSYTLFFTPDSMRDRAGFTVRDSINHVYWETGRPGQFGTISGTIEDAKEDSGAFYITLLTEAGKPAGYTVRTERAGKFMFSGVKPGVYSYTVFRDRDGNGRYSFGSEYPFIPAERFDYFDDPVEVRASWDTEGLKIILH